MALQRIFELRGRHYTGKGGTTSIEVERDETDVWVRITPAFTGSPQFYEWHSESGVVTTQYATTAKAAVVHMKVVDLPGRTGSEARIRAARITTQSIMDALDEIHTGGWGD